MKKLLSGIACAVCAFAAAACGTAAPEGSLTSLVGEWESAMYTRHVTDSSILRPEGEDLKAFAALLDGARFTKADLPNESADRIDDSELSIWGTSADAVLYIGKDGSIEAFVTSVSSSGEEQTEGYTAPAGSVSYEALSGFTVG